jgi:hypothetical protein
MIGINQLRWSLAKPPRRSTSSLDPRPFMRCRRQETMITRFVCAAVMSRHRDRRIAVCE